MIFDLMTAIIQGMVLGATIGLAATMSKKMSEWLTRNKPIVGMFIVSVFGVLFFLLLIKIDWNVLSQVILILMLMAIGILVAVKLLREG